MSTDRQQLRKIIEGVLLAAAQPLSVAKIAALFNDAEQPPVPAKEDIVAVLEDIQADCRDRGYELKEVGSGWRFQVCVEVAPWINRLWEEKPQKYSRATLETLALIAYRQPITRGDIEEIRGVAVSSNIVKSLVEREWVKVVGHRDVPGRPSLYATTRQFLDYFNLSSLEELPSLSELGDPDKLDPELELDIAEVDGENSASELDTAETDGENPASELDIAETDGENPASELDIAETDGENPASELDTALTDGENSASELDIAETDGESPA